MEGKLTLVLETKIVETIMTILDETGPHKVVAPVFYAMTEAIRENIPKEEEDDSKEESEETVLN